MQDGINKDNVPLKVHSKSQGLNGQLPQPALLQALSVCRALWERHRELPGTQSAQSDVVTSFHVFGQNVTAIKLGRCTTAVMRPATVNAEKVPLGPSVTTAFPITTGDRGVFVSTAGQGVAAA